MPKAKTDVDQGLPVEVEGPSFTLQGDLTVPQRAQGMVLFAHGSGSGRQSPRNRFVARMLSDGGLATLLLDLLTVQEEQIDAITAEYRFDIEMLAGRLIAATEWLESKSETKDFRIGYFGASTGSAAALKAAVQRPQAVKAIVSRGGRPDLAREALPRVEAPTLLIVGGLDSTVLQLNEAALSALRCEKKLVVVPGATHLFEEPGTLEQVAQHAKEWFNRFLRFSPTSSP